MKTRWSCAMLVGLALAGGGCVSVKVGQPTTQTAVYKAETISQGIEGREAAEVGPTVEQDGEALQVGLRGRVRVTERKADIYRELTVTRQRRMGIGFFPAYASDNARKGGKLIPVVGGELFENRAAFDKAYSSGGYCRGGWNWTMPDGTVLFQSVDAMTIAGFFGFLLETPIALIVTPFFGDWEPDNLWWRGEGIEAIYQLSPEDRARVGINTCKPQWFASEFQHAAFLGFNRTTDIKLDTRFVRNEPFAVTNLTEEVTVKGPYEIEMEIPSAGYKRKQLVEEGKTWETFYLPADVGAEGKVEVEIRFYATEGADNRNADARAVLDGASGRVFTEKILFPGKSGE